MAYVPITGGIGVQPIATKSTTQLHPIGQIIQAVDSTYGTGEFIYLKGVASTVVGSWVSYAAGTGLTALIVASLKGLPLAVSMTTNTTTTSYAWYQISGTALALGLTSITISAGFIYLSGTTGSVDDASVAGDLIYCAKKTTPPHVAGTFLDAYLIARPFTSDRISLAS